MTSRRSVLAGIGLASVMPALAKAAGTPASAMSGASSHSVAPAADFVSLYDVDRTVVNFDSAYYGAMTKPVMAAYQEKQLWVNRFNSTFLRGAVEDHPLAAEMDKSVAAVAELIKAGKNEVALSAGGTDALYALIANYRPIKPGDSVIYADVDYDEMQFAMQFLKESKGANLVRLSLPEPHTRANLLAAYEKVLKEAPRPKLLLLTHVSNRNGLVPPVKEIVAMAKARGVDVILDSAQAVGQMPFDVADTGADFIGFSLHKWLAAPLGTGAIYIRKERLADISPWFGNHIYDDADIRARLPTGTVDFAARLTIPAAIAVQEQIGIERKFAHLRALRDHWYSRAKAIKGVSLLLPEEPANYGAISAFRLPGMKTIEQTRSAQRLFLQKHKLLIVAKAGLQSGAVLRVTPGLFNTTEELDRLVAAIRQERALFA